MKTNKVLNITSTPSWTKAVVVVGGHGHSPAALTVERDTVPLTQISVLVPEPIWNCVENIGYTGIRSSDPPIRNKSQYRLLEPDRSKLWQVLNKTSEIHVKKMEVGRFQ
jgi:hypothetical protein